MYHANKNGILQFIHTHSVRQMQQYEDMKFWNKKNLKSFNLQFLLCPVLNLKDNELKLCKV